MSLPLSIISSGLENLLDSQEMCRVCGKDSFFSACSHLLSCLFYLNIKLFYSDLFLPPWIFFSSKWDVAPIKLWVNTLRPSKARGRMAAVVLVLIAHVCEDLFFRVAWVRSVFCSGDILCQFISSHHSSEKISTAQDAHYTNVLLFLPPNVVLNSWSPSMKLFKVSATCFVLTTVS